LSLDEKFHSELEKIKTNYENEMHNVLGQRIELKLIPGTQSIYAADFSLACMLKFGLHGRNWEKNS
jgi:hypothetical protein